MFRRSQTRGTGGSLHLHLPAAESFCPLLPSVCAAAACEPQAQCVLSPGLSVWEVKTDLSYRLLQGYKVLLIVVFLFCN